MKTEITADATWQGNTCPATGMYTIHVKTRRVGDSVFAYLDGASSRGFPPPTTGWLRTRRIIPVGGFSEAALHDTVSDLLVIPTNPHDDFVAVRKNACRCACSGCRRVHQAIHVKGGDLAFIAERPPHSSRYTGHARITCENPPAVIKRGIVWEFDFRIDPDRPTLYITHLSFPHPHDFLTDDGERYICLGGTARDTARSLFGAGDPASAIAVLLQAARQAETSHWGRRGLPLILGIRYCSFCNAIHRSGIRNFKKCSQCKKLTCPTCGREKIGRKIFCKHCADVYRREHAEYTFSDDVSSVREDSLVRLGRNPVLYHGQRARWYPRMEQHVGKIARVRYICGSGWAHVDVDGSSNCWYIGSMQVATMRSQT